MKNFLLLLACYSCLFPVAQNAAYIEYKITSNQGANGSIKIKYSEFGISSLFEMVIPQMPGGGITIKSLSQKNSPGLVYTINDNNKTYSENKSNQTSKEDTKTYTVKKLGEEMVNGYKCVHALVMEGAETHETWNTKDIPEYTKYSEAFSLNKRTGSSKREEALKEAGCDGLPVKSIHKGVEREGEITMELVKIEKKSFNKTDFEIPSGYNKTEGAGMAAPQMKSQQEIINMSPEERTKYIEEMKKKYGK